jgi:hypothetical protein
MKARLAPILLAALAVAGGAAARAHAEDPAPMQAAPVLAMSVDFTDPAFVPPGMTVVFVPAAGDGFSDGGDGPGGLECVLPAGLPDGFGFADGGDILPDGFVAALARPAGEEFWRDGVVPEGLVPVLAWLPGDGFADGGDLLDGFVPVLFPATDSPCVSNGG